MGDEESKETRNKINVINKEYVVYYNAIEWGVRERF